MIRAPAFWWQPPGVWATVLRPVGAAVAAVAARRWRRAVPSAAGIPVVCVGNLVVGGAGKTPVAIALTLRLAEAGHRPHLLSRGYKGRLKGPVKVDRKRHTAADVGDEPLLLARYAPTWVSRDRAAGAQAAQEDGATVIVMDDGFQNPGLAKTLSLLVIDGATGLGNGLVLPAGPLRERPEAGLARADAIIVMGDDLAGVAAALADAPLPILSARLEADDSARRLAGQPVVAFAGIGRPEKFFDLLEGIGCRLVHRFAYADHQAYDTDDLASMVDLAAAAEALLVTTSKDWVRLPASYRDRVHRVPVHAAFADEAALDRILAPVAGRG